MKIERRLNKLDGIQNAKVDLANETAGIYVQHNGPQLSFIKNEIDKLGYKAIEQESDEEDLQAETEKAKARSLFKKKIRTSLSLSVLILQ